jgi:2-hydroxyacyl-CoA lyase 1
MRVAKRPLVIIGKGAAYSRAEDEVRKFIDMTGFPFLPTPMGKGVVPDSHELNISPARSLALRESDVVILIGARLNWILHFGLPSRFAKGVKIIQIDIHPEQHDHNVDSSARLVGDCKISMEMLSEKLKGFKYKEKDWIFKLKKKSVENLKMNTQLI